LATGGSDGTVAVWDHRAKKRIKLYNRLSSAISALAFDADGTQLAIGVSSMQDVTSDSRKRDLGHIPNHVSIVVRDVGEELRVSF
jgi:cell cycle arrest protein BUB3